MIDSWKRRIATNKRFKGHINQYIYISFPVLFIMIIINKTKKSSYDESMLPSSSQIRLKTVKGAFSHSGNISEPINTVNQ